MKQLTEAEKDTLIKTLQEKIAISEKEKVKEDFYKPYRCGKCNMEVAFTYILPAIKEPDYAQDVGMSDLPSSHNGYCMACGSLYGDIGCTNKDCFCYKPKEETMAQHKKSTTKRNGNGSQRKQK